MNARLNILEVSLSNIGGSVLKMKFALCSTVFLALLSAPAIAQDFVLFKTFGNDVPLNGNAKGTFSWGVIDGNSSTAEVVDAPVGAEPDSLAYTMKGGTAGTKGIALYVGDLDVEYDISPYSYVNFYVKVPAGAGAREWTLNLRERGAAGRSSGDAPRGEGAIGAWNTHPGFVEGEWSYISVPFTALAPTDGDAGNPVPFSGDFSLFTDLWIYNNAG